MRLDPNQESRRVLAIASGGGHWIQLWRMRPAWDGCDVVYATTDEGFAAEVERDARARCQSVPRLVVVTDANRWQKLRLIQQFVQVVLLILRTRPDIVVTTGASVGFFALRVGRIVGARTAWVDSIANAEEMSLSGQRAGVHADLWLTQWAHLERPDGPHYSGAVL